MSFRGPPQSQAVMAPRLPNVNGGGSGLVVPLDVLPVGGAQSTGVTNVPVGDFAVLPLYPTGAYRLHLISTFALAGAFTLVMRNLPHPDIPIAIIPPGTGIYSLAGQLALGTVYGTLQTGGAGGDVVLTYDVIDVPKFI